MFPFSKNARAGSNESYTGDCAALRGIIHATFFRPKYPLAANADLSEIPFAADQVRFLDNDCCEVLDTGITSSETALLFSVHARTIRTYLLSQPESSNAPARPRMIKGGDEMLIALKLGDQCESNKAFSKSPLLLCMYRIDVRKARAQGLG
jgi:hypothetical protein